MIRVRRVFLIVALLAGCGGNASTTAERTDQPGPTAAPTAAPPVENANLPPVGQVWFGTTFDPNTFEIASRIESVGATQSFVQVARLAEPIDAADLIMRISWDGQVVSNTAVNATGAGDLWGFTGGPLFEPGVWLYEFTDIGGNVLASGQIVVIE